MEMINIDDNIYAYINEPGTWFRGNSGFIKGNKMNIVIDSLATEDMAKNYINEISRISNVPVRIIVNTHAHGDHAWTNYMFENAINIAQSNYLESINDPTEKLYSKYFPDFDFSRSRYSVPDITVSHGISLYIDEKEIKVMHLPNAHTSGDLIAYIPDNKIVFTGDILFSKPCTPFAMTGSIRGSIMALEFLKSLRARVYVPGHGPVSYGTEKIDAALKYFKFVQSEASKILNSSDDVIAAARSIDLGEYKSWLNPERIIGNISRACMELNNNETMINEDKIISAMMDYKELLERS
ncbi:Glyoxylase, beta-lactamase superfamily II [Picrophilus oshimae DSM 9789]|uniref:Glyoxylase, beta-lactamase superfamily II n=2 Tax=Picrophilus oshimae TaxID=46632 RepID=A0A8G2FVN4_PICTO|nr:Glyoxylase, beta-lactamase superfamily II [Picrophilus oshimae DSM 9789]